MTNVASGAGRAKFNELTREVWPAFQWIARLDAAPASLEERVGRLEAQSAVRDLLTRYAYFFDSGDFDGVISLFDDEAVVINNTIPATATGIKEIETMYHAFLDNRPAGRVGFHRVSNVLVRLTPGNSSEGWLAAYLKTMGKGADQPASSLVGSYVIRAIKRTDVWKIADCRIIGDFRAGYVSLP